MTNAEVSGARPAAPPHGREPLERLVLELTGRCQQECKFCYAGSGPAGTDGVMTMGDWTRVIREAGAMGTTAAQFIGGEATLHPGLCDLIEVALHSGIREVEVFTNLVSVTDRQWAAFSLPGVRLATTLLTDDATEHMALTGRPTLPRILANVERATELGVPLRAKVIEVRVGQRTEQARQLLVDMGVTEIAMDTVRAIGRGGHGRAPDVSQLCGRCAEPTLAVTPTGVAFPCVMSRWLDVGDVRKASLENTLDGGRLAAVRGQLRQAFAQARPGTACGPNNGGPPPPPPPPCAPFYI